MTCHLGWWVAVVAASISMACASESICYGTSSQGRIESAELLPEAGPNFQPYSRLGVLLGRTYVHSRVAATVRDAFKELEHALPGRTYVYAESGWKNGGRIKPHRTHQNGTAVDFLVPVTLPSGAPGVLATGLTNKYGYGYEFNDKGKAEGYAIDFEALAAHLNALNAASRRNGIAISRVIFDAKYLPRLFDAKGGALVKDQIPFMQGEPWIRHDEHYHVDFAIKCRPDER